MAKEPVSLLLESMEDPRLVSLNSSLNNTVSMLLGFCIDWRYMEIRKLNSTLLFGQPCVYSAVSAALYCCFLICWPHAVDIECIGSVPLT